MVGDSLAEFQGDFAVTALGYGVHLAREVPEAHRGDVSALANREDELVDGRH